MRSASRLNNVTYLPGSSSAPDCLAICYFAAASMGYNRGVFTRPMDYVIRPLTQQDEPILWEMLYYGLSSAGKSEPPPSRDVVRRPEIARYVEDWGRVGDAGFVAHDKKNRALLGAAWLRRPTDKSDASPELALAVKPEHRRHGIGTALLTHLVRAHPDQSTISVNFVAGKPVLRLYERFGFKVVEQRTDAVVMQRPT